LPVIQAAFRIDGDENVVIEVPRVSIVCGPIGEGSGFRRNDNLPGSGSEKIFPRDLRECLDKHL